MRQAFLGVMVLMAVTPAYAKEEGCGSPTLLETVGKYKLLDVSCDSDMKDFWLVDDKGKKIFADSYVSSVNIQRSGDSPILVYKTAGEKLSQKACLEKCPKQKEFAGWRGKCQAAFLQTLYYNIEKKAVQKNEAHGDEVICLNWGLQ